MNIIEVEQGTDAWLGIRSGKITGTKIGKLFAKSRKADEWFDHDKKLLEFYRIVAERLTDSSDTSSNRERGHELESEAIDLAEKQLGLEFIRGNVWQFSQNHIGSPDGYTADGKIAIEVKCLASERHIMAIDTGTPPIDYWFEYLNYFMNPNLESLYIYLYDPRFIFEKLQSHYWRIDRETAKEDIEKLASIAEDAENQIQQTINNLLSK